LVAKPDFADASRPPLTRAEIVKTALRLRIADDAGALSMRRLAAALDVTPMALYRHFEGKDDILLAMADELLAEHALPSAAVAWAAYLHELAVSLRGMLRTEPFVVSVFARRPVVSPAAQRRLATATSVLTRAGFTVDAAVRAYATVHIYTLGFCMLEQARDAAGHVGIPLDTRSTEAVQISGFVSEGQFLAGLDAILAGIAPVGA
jgi:AcrR family transcriptional regulator